MTATHANAIVDGYMKRLDGELEGLPAGRRKEVASQIAEHIAEARAQLADESDADLLTILDRLGEPDEIAAEARARFDVTTDRPGIIEILALILLLAGGIFLIFPPVPWLVGIAFVWRSRVWSPRTKYYGAYAPFVAALGVVAISALVASLFSGQLYEAPIGVALILLLLLPLGSGIFLAVRLRGRLPVLGWIAVLIVCVAVYVPTVSMFFPPKESAFIATPGGDPKVADCAAFYGTLQFSPNTPIVAKVPVSVGICWDGQQVRKTWGPDCYPTAGLGVIVTVQSCDVTPEPDGSLIITVQASERSMTSLVGMTSGGGGWRITPDGQIDQFG